MPYSYSELKQFLGLFAQSNSFNLPEGAMETATNIVINDDNVISKQRGFYRYFSPLTGTLNALYNYQNKLLALYRDKMSYFSDTGAAPNLTGSESILSGATVSVGSDRTSRGVEQNANLYFTTDNGILKLDAYNGTLFQAGASQALDIRGSFLPQNGPISAETSFAVRVVFGRVDSNNNTVLGAPSDILTLTNSKQVSQSYTSSGSGTYTVTVTTPGHNLSAGMSITVSAASNSHADGVQTITAVTSTTFSYEVASNPGSGTLSWTATRAPIYFFSIPSDISNTSQKWFYQVYRTSQSSGSSVVPTANFRLIDQVNLSSAEITAGFVSYTDQVEDLLVTFAPELYTNPNSREGEDQANYRPPLCQDVTLFNNYTFYANCETRQLLDLDVVSTSTLSAADFVEFSVIDSGSRTTTTSIVNAGGDLQINATAHGLVNNDTVYIDQISGGSLTTGIYYVVSATTDAFEISSTSGGASILYSAVSSLRFKETTTRRYVAKSGVGNRTVRSEGITNAAGDLQIDYTAHGLSNGDYIYISNITGGSLTAGHYYVVSAGTNAFEISLTSGGASILHSAVTSLYFEGVTNGTLPIFQLDTLSGDTATKLRNTAQGLVKAVNRDTLSPIYGNYISGITDTPGQMRFTAKGFTGTIYVRANSAGAADAFYPVPPTSFNSGTQVFSLNDVQPNAVYTSKIGEPEAVPYVNVLLVGSRNKAIRRIIALRNSVIVLKEDGVWKITGDNPLNFSATNLDTTVTVIAPNTAAALNNQIYFLAIDGVCVATDSSVAIVSRKIENRIENIVGLSNISEISSAVAYDSDRTYRLCTTLPNQSTRVVTYFHNSLNDTWTDSDQLFVGGVIGPGNIMYYISTDNRILKERKDGTRIDFSNQSHSVTVTSIATDLLSGVIVCSSAIPQEGDFIVKDDVVSRISSVSSLGGSSYQVAFFYVTNLVAADSVQLYERIVSTIKMAPFHGGMVGRGKQFSQLQIHQRSPNITKILATFTGQTFVTSDETSWTSQDTSTSNLGWGLKPWGYSPWGDSDTIDIQFTTQPAPVVRLYVPLFQQRNTFIQTELVHRQGGESLDIQAMSWTLRVYNERVTK